MDPSYPFAGYAEGTVLFIGRRVSNQIASSFLFNLASRESCDFVCAYPQQTSFESEIITRNAISRLHFNMEWNGMF